MNLLRALLAPLLPPLSDARAYALEPLLPHAGAVSFQQRKSHAERCALTCALRQRYPARVPLVAERDPCCTHLRHLERCQCLVHEQMYTARFHYELARLLEVTVGALRVRYNTSSAVAPTRSLRSVHDEHAHADGYLYVRYRCAACAHME